MISKGGMCLVFVSFHEINSAFMQHYFLYFQFSVVTLIDT